MHDMQEHGRAKRLVSIITRHAGNLLTTNHILGRKCRVLVVQSKNTYNFDDFVDF